jgi:hypothetical protein
MVGLKTYINHEASATASLFTTASLSTSLQVTRVILHYDYF